MMEITSEMLAQAEPQSKDEALGFLLAVVGTFIAENGSSLNKFGRKCTPLKQAYMKAQRFVDE